MLFRQILFPLPEFVSLTGDPNVQRRKEEHAEEQRADKATDNDNRKRPLRIGTNRVGKRCRQKAKRGH